MYSILFSSKSHMTKTPKCLLNDDIILFYHPRFHNRK